MSESNKHFIETFDAIQEIAFDVNNSNGWWDERVEIYWSCNNSGIDYNPHLAIELIGLAHTELSEAVEAVRKHPYQNWADDTTKDTMVRELAGAVVRIMDMSEYFGLPLSKAIIAEIEHNKQRGHMHGGKKA